MVRRLKIIASLGIFVPSMTFSSYTPVAAKPGTTVWQIEDTLQGAAGANFTIAQVDIPATLTAAGTYSLIQDVSGGVGAPVISITGNNVTLDLKGHTISRPSGQAPISIQARDTIVRNGFINESLTSFSGSLLMNNSSNFVIEDIVFLAPVGVTIGSGILIISNSSNGIIRNCFFNNYSIGCALGNLGSANNISNVLISNCTMINSLSAAVNCLPGSFNITVKDLVIQGGGGGVLARGINFIAVENTIVENIGRAVNNSGVSINSCVGAVVSHVDVVGTGSQAIPVSGVFGIVVHGTTNGCLVNECSVVGATGDGISIGFPAEGPVTNTIVRGCMVNDCGGIGVHFQAPLSPTNHVYNTIASSNAGGNFVNSDGLLIATSIADTTTANYWYNVSD